MALRITSASTKAGVVVSGRVLNVFLGFGAVFVTGVLAVLSALALMFSEPSEPLGLSATVMGPFYVLVAVAYFFSAFNLRRGLKARRPAWVQLRRRRRTAR